MRGGENQRSDSRTQNPEWNGEIKSVFVSSFSPCYLSDTAEFPEIYVIAYNNNKNDSLACGRLHSSYILDKT